MSKSFFDIAGSEYWTAPWKNLKKIAWDAMVKGTPEFAIDAPEFVPLDERKTIPLLAFQSGPSAALAKCRFEDLVVVALVDLTENRLVAQRLPRPTAPPVAGAPASPGFACLEYKIELTELFDVRWEASSYIGTVFMREQASNRVTIKLGRAPAAYEDPEVQKYIDAHRTKMPARPLDPPVFSQVMWYGPVERSLKPPAKAGIEMHIERVLVARPAERAWLEVGFRLAVSKTDIIRQHEKAPGEEGPQYETARAVISLLIFGSDSNVPRTFQLVVPSFEKVEGEPDAPIAQGVFSVDIAGLANLTMEPQTYFVYAFSGEVMAGPAVVAFVDPKLLPV